MERVHTEELHDLYSSPNIIRLMKSRRLRWTELVAHMGEKISTYRLSAGKCLEDQGLDRRTILTFRNLASYI